MEGCGTVMIYCSSGSYYGKVLVPVPVPDPDLFSTVFQQQNICTKSSLFNAKSSIVPRKLASNFGLFDFCIHFRLDPEQECITVPGLVPLRQKVEVPAVPVPQHCFYVYIFLYRPPGGTTKLQEKPPGLQREQTALFVSCRPLTP